jgi:hypothetical protein
LLSLSEGKIKTKDNVYLLFKKSSFEAKKLLYWLWPIAGTYPRSWDCIYYLKCYIPAIIKHEELHTHTHTHTHIHTHTLIIVVFFYGSDFIYVVLYVLIAVISFPSIYGLFYKVNILLFLKYIWMYFNYGSPS